MHVYRRFSEFSLLIEHGVRTKVFVFPQPTTVYFFSQPWSPSWLPFLRVEVGLPFGEDPQSGQELSPSGQRHTWSVLGNSTARSSEEARPRPLLAWLRTDLTMRLIRSESLSRASSCRVTVRTISASWLRPTGSLDSEDSLRYTGMFWFEVQTQTDLCNFCYFIFACNSTLLTYIEPVRYMQWLLFLQSTETEH